jgi:hypothetical protein
MRKIRRQLLCGSALAFLALALVAAPVRASDTDVANVSGFGALVATDGTVITSPGNWTANVSESVYLNAGVYTYVWTLANSGSSFVGLSQATTATVGSPNVNNLSSALDFGVVLGLSSVTADDNGFSFGPNSFRVNLIDTGGELAPGDQLTFYAQSTLGPALGTIGTQDGGTSFSGASLDPGATPEPDSLLLLGTGLLSVGGYLRRRVLAV